ncbi:Zinc-containing alcohol dehydrogenase superfamily protein [gamma proteobacterium HdN1]|nr:Zinc-containing alcohol dehydrogenase superfamily protein [gamma proteobacterium HdN1]
MKAAVLHAYGQIPQYDDLPKPQPQAGQVLIKLEAASIKQLDKLKASGKHYTRYDHFPVAVGVDGVGRLVSSGERVYAMGLTGMLADYALVNPEDCAPVPEAIDAALAAVLPNALLGSDAALLYRADFQPGQTLLIHGATGVSGRMAVQAARLRGAHKIIVTGRNAESLNYLRCLGADACISLLDTPEQIVAQLSEIQQQSPLDVVLDYLWGEPTLWLLQALNRHCPKPVRIITIGQMAGADISLPSGLLRSKPISLSGSGLGSISSQQLRDYNQKQLGFMFEQAIQEKITADYRCYRLDAVEQAWQATLAPGERAVIKI